jgi:hypothetical protein
MSVLDQIRAIEDDLRHLPTDSCSVNGFLFDNLSKYQTRALCVLARALLSLSPLDSGSADRKLDQILAHLERITMNEQDLQTDLDAIKAGVATVLAAQTAQAATIADLKAQLAAGTPVSQAQLDALDAEAKAIVTSLTPLAAPPA